MPELISDGVFDSHAFNYVRSRMGWNHHVVTWIVTDGARRILLRHLSEYYGQRRSLAANDPIVAARLGWIRVNFAAGYTMDNFINIYGSDVRHNDSWVIPLDMPLLFSGLTQIPASQAEIVYVRERESWIMRDEPRFTVAVQPNPYYGVSPTAAYQPTIQTTTTGTHWVTVPVEEPSGQEAEAEEEEQTEDGDIYV